MLKSKIKKIIFLSAASLLIAFSSLMTLSTEALSGSQFKAGNIIADSIFYNGNTMTGAQIQSFLNSKVPQCDTWGKKPYAGTTRARYAASKGVSTPFICLKSKSHSVPARSANAYCRPISSGTKTSAQVIDEVARACDVNEKALIVLLEKEQSLITDDWPWPVQYRSAMGYGCPDSGPNYSANCSSEYYGFFNQVYNAAKQFKRYKNEPNLFNYRANRTSYVQWHPNPGCGGSNVAMQNSATAGLYNYTPYRPNSAALTNLYGTGNSCSSYGNRNFWVLFNNWFGKTYVGCTSSDQYEAVVYRSYRADKNRHFFTRKSCERDVLQYTLNYKYEGIAFSSAPEGQPNRIPVYRAYDPKSGYHFWTKNLNERNKLVNNYGWRAEGTGFTAYSIGGTNRKPVYRLYNPRLQVHLYTSAKSEISTAKNNGYKYEGIAFYVPS